ncbi:MAG: hypothetical protein ACP5F3_00645 [Candidatus Syntrophosphaera sp.]
MKVILMIIMALAMMVPLAAQVDLPKPNFNPYGQSGSSLFDLNRLQMNHSVGFSAGMSSSGYGFYLSRYTNHLQYKFNPKLDLELDLSFVNFGSSTSSLDFNSDNQSRIIPEFKLNYRPSDSVNFQIEFHQGYPGYYDTRPWYERW